MTWSWWLLYPIGFLAGVFGYLFWSIHHYWGDGGLL
jgi:hypothetical protein